MGIGAGFLLNVRRFCICVVPNRRLDDSPQRDSIQCPASLVVNNRPIHPVFSEHKGESPLQPHATLLIRRTDRIITYICNGLRGYSTQELKRFTHDLKCSDYDVCLRKVFFQLLKHLVINKFEIYLRKNDGRKGARIVQERSRAGSAE